MGRLRSPSVGAKIASESVPSLVARDLEALLETVSLVV